MSAKKFTPVPAQTVTLTFAIRPTYADTETFKREVEDSLEGLIFGHDAATLSWGPDGQGVFTSLYPDEEDEWEG